MANKVHFEPTEEESAIGSQSSLSKSVEKLEKQNKSLTAQGSIHDSTYKRDSDPATSDSESPKTPTVMAQKGDKTPTNTSQKLDKSGTNTPKRFDKTFSVALTQALLTSDTKLLHKLLSTKDSSSIQDTVAELTPPLVISLLEFILSGLIKSPNQLYSREGWINSILRVHNTLFTRNNRAKQLLVRLNRYIVGRLSVNKSLLKLKGKVDGLVYMVSMCNKANNSGTKKTAEGGGQEENVGLENRETLITFTAD